MRKFYTKMDAAFDALPPKLNVPDSALYNLYRLLYYREDIIQILMEDIVCFRKDNADPGSDVMDFWARIRRVRHYDLPTKDKLYIWYTYDKRINAERTKRRLCADLANLAMLNNNSTEERTFGEDFCDAYTLLNDNDFKALERMEEIKKSDPTYYKNLRAKKARQIKPLLKKMQDEYAAALPDAAQNVDDNCVTLDPESVSSFQEDLPTFDVPSGKQMSMDIKENY